MISSAADMPQNADPAPAGSPGLSELLRTALDGISEAVIITGPQLERPGPVIEHVNAAFSRMTGYSAEEVIGQAPRILQGPLTDRTVLDHLRSDLETREAFQGTAINYRKDGSTYTLHWHITPLRGEAGQITHWVALQREIKPGDQISELPEERVNRVRALTAQAAAGMARKIGLAADPSHMLAQLAQTSRDLEEQVRTTLALVRSVARRTAETNETGADDATHLDSRVDALQRLDGAARQSSWSGVDLEWLVANELHAFELEREDRVRIAGPPITLLPRAAELFGLAVHELTANAVKFGALAHSKGSVAVRWRVQSTAGAPWLVFRWAERGGPAPRQPAHKGFGLQLLEKILPADFNGRSKVRFLSSGLLCQVDLPMSPQIAQIS
jgi:PAS domain S-box-containing protein